MERVRIQYDELKRSTEQAYLFRIDGEDIWLPKSQASVYEKKKVVYIPEWLAMKADLI